MIYQDICKTIKMGIKLYEENNGIYPNEVIISRDILEVLKNYIALVIGEEKIDDNPMILGLNVIVDEKNSEVIKIAYTLKINFIKYEK